MFIIKYFILGVSLFYLSYLDIRYRRIPNKFLLFLFIVGLTFLPFSTPYASYLLGFLFPALILFFLNLLFGHFIGGGDIKLTMCIGLYMGLYYNCIIFTCASLICLCFSSLYFIFKKGFPTHLPLCPFLLISYLLIFFHTI